MVKRCQGRTEISLCIRENIFRHGYAESTKLFVLICEICGKKFMPWTFGIFSVHLWQVQILKLNNGPF